MQEVTCYLLWRARVVKDMIESKDKLKEMFDKEIVFADDLLILEAS